MVDLTDPEAARERTMPDTKSDTPRVDAVVFTERRGTLNNGWTVELVHASDARDLERALSAAAAEAERERDEARAGHLNIAFDGAVALAHQYRERAEAAERSLAGMREACAQRCEAVGKDWKDAGDPLKFYAAEYLADAIRDIPDAAGGPTGRPQYGGTCGELHKNIRLDAPIRARTTETEAWAKVDDLAMMIRKLVRALRKAVPDSDVATRAMDYLTRHGLEGSPLRAPPAVPRAAPEETKVPDIGNERSQPR